MGRASIARGASRHKSMDSLAFGYANSTWSEAATYSSHGHERTHLDGVQAVGELLAVYLQTELTFPEWDVAERGALEHFPSGRVQPAPLEDVIRADDS